MQIKKSGIKIRYSIFFYTDYTNNECEMKFRLSRTSALYSVEKISKTLDEMVYNVGSSAEVGAKYIIAAVQKKVRERKENNEKNA